MGQPGCVTFCHNYALGQQDDGDETDLLYLSQQELQGFEIVDTGATRSMSGVTLLTFMQQSLADHFSEYVMAIDPDATTRFTYANGSSDASYGQVGMPHELGLEAESKYLWFTAVPLPSPTLLGLDWMEAEGVPLGIPTQGH